MSNGSSTVWEPMAPGSSESTGGGRRDGSGQSFPNPQQSLGIRPYDTADAAVWDDLVARSCNGTLLHTRRYLDYHGSRFRDRSLVIEDGRGKIVGVFPAAESSPSVVASHPGLTYGGVVHDGSVRGDRMLDVLRLVASRMEAQGYRDLLYKVVPFIYHGWPADDDRYSLSRMGGSSECDLSAAICIDHRGGVSHGRKSGRKLAARAGVKAQIGWERIDEFWALLAQALSERHQAAPVHSLEEINRLHDSFPKEILLCTALVDGSIAAGTVLYCAGPVVHTQYIASSSAGRAVSALDPVIEQSIEFAETHGYRYLDFGISNEGHGGALNTSLHDFKISFGAGAVIYEQIRLRLRQQETT
jgi:hypothetical protein